MKLIYNTQAKEITYKLIIFTSIAEAIGNDVIIYTSDDSEIGSITVEKIIHDILYDKVNEVASFLKVAKYDFTDNVIVVVNDKISNKSDIIDPNDEIIIFYPAEGGS